MDTTRPKHLACKDLRQRTISACAAEKKQQSHLRKRDIDNNHKSKTQGHFNKSNYLKRASYRHVMLTNVFYLTWFVTPIVDGRRDKICNYKINLPCRVQLSFLAVSLNLLDLSGEITTLEIASK